jgi:uncharacterized repeat protein (TIGR03803 family)
MWRKRFRSLLRHFLTILALVAAFIASAMAKPKFKILHTVPGGLFSGLTFDTKGNLYGVTGAGGDDNQGTIFELTPGVHGWTLTTLHSFNGQDGGTPNGGLIFDAAGNFYGTALGGPSSQGGGVAYEMVRGASGWTFATLYDFCVQYHCPDGGFPGPLTIDGAGNLFGLAAGGTYDEGVAFELASGVSVSGWNEQVLYDFEGTKTGFGPTGALIFDRAGDLYGTTYRGGKISSSCYAGCGTVFRLRHSSGSWTESVLFSFDGRDGLSPYSGVVSDRSERLYGTTNQGGSGNCGEATCGTVFRLTRQPGGRWKEAVLYDFPHPAAGNNPTSGVIIDKVGNVYGTAGGGDSSCSGGCGVVYRLSPTANGKWQYTVLHEFTGQDGFYPAGGVVLDSKGNVYGTAYSVVFEITP